MLTLTRYSKDSKEQSTKDAPFVSKYLAKKAAEEAVVHVVEVATADEVVVVAVAEIEKVLIEETNGIPEVSGIFLESAKLPGLNIN